MALLPRHPDFVVSAASLGFSEIASVYLPECPRPAESSTVYVIKLTALITLAIGFTHQYVDGLLRAVREKRRR